MDAQTAVYFSVGTETGDLKQYPGLTVDITGGTATFNAVQADRIGVGDEVTYNGGTVAFISGRTNNWTYTLLTATGTTPPNVSGAPVNSIRRAFNTLNAANTGAAAHLGTTDLLANGFQLNLACYDDGPLDDVSGAFLGIGITGWTTGVNNYVRVYAPFLTTEVGASQRHDGTAGTGFRIVPTQPAPGSFFPIVQLGVEHIRFEGIEIDGSNVTGAEEVDGVYVSGFTTAGSEVRVDGLIVHDLINTTVNDATASFVKGLTMQDGNLFLTSSIFYDIESVSNHALSMALGVELNEATATNFVHNVTVLNIKQTSGGTAEANGVADWNSVTTVRNTYVGDVVSSGGPDECYRLVGAQNNNVSSDASAMGAGSQTGESNYVSYFVNVTDGSEDLHLKNDSLSLWGSPGADLDGDPNLPVTEDIDVGGRDPNAPDIGADEFGVCAPLSVTQAGGLITVTGEGQYELVFDDAIGGAIDKFFDLVEDPTRTNDLAGGTGSQKGLFIDEVQVGGTNYRNADASTGARSQLLEVTPTRVRVREASRFADTVGNVVRGAETYGNYSVYPSGRMAIGWQRRTTAMVNFTQQQTHVNVRFDAVAAPYNAWSPYSESGPLAPTQAGADDFVLARSDVAGMRTDFLLIQHTPWALADQTSWGTNNPGKWAEATWFDTNAGTLPASEAFDFLMYFKPTNFGDNTDTAVFGRSDDYTVPDDISVADFAVGARWDEDGNNDGFNESEAVYTMDVDPATGLTFDMDGGATRRYSPFFKIRQWRSMHDPSLVDLEGTTLVNNVNFRADVKPVARAQFSKDVTWYSTMGNVGPVTSPNIGSAGTVDPGVTFPVGRYGRTASYTSDGQFISIVPTGNVDPAEGTIEFWYQPRYDFGTGNPADDMGLFGYYIDANNSFQAWHQPNEVACADNGLKFSIVSGGTVFSTSTGIPGCAPEYWRANEWVHLRFVWDSSPQRLEIYVNGQLASAAPSGSYGTPVALDSVFYIGEREFNGGLTNHADGRIDEFTIYSSANAITTLANGGLKTSPNENLASTTNNFEFTFTGVDALKRGEYLYVGSDSQFRGLNVALATPGAGVSAGALVWEYWGGINVGWGDLEAVAGFTDETDDLSQDGTVYWTDDPFEWSLYSLSGEPELYWIRVSLTNGETYSTAPREALIKTDILLFQYCEDITANAMTFNFLLPTPTSVELESFEARALDGSVELRWRTASELDNLGFHVYRSPDGRRWTRITPRAIPGLGSSPMGADYRYLDSGLTNGTTYFYELEDIETTGRTERHGPVSATPRAGQVPAPERPLLEEDDLSARLSYGEPEASSFRIVPQKNGVKLVLDTGGFVAVPQDDGSVRLEVSGLVESMGASLPVKRAWVEAVAGRDVKIVSIRARGVERFANLHPSGQLVPEITASPRGTVRARLVRRGRRAARREGAKLIEVAYQEATKKALFELSPFTSNGDGLVLAKRLEVSVAFRGREKSASVDGARKAKGRTILRLVAVERGLYAVSLEELLGRRRARKTKALRLSRQGESVRYHLDRDSLYFWSEGAAANPYGHESVYELELGVAGETMEVVDYTGSDAGFYWHEEQREENRYYQAALVHAPDIWLWELLFAPERKSFAFDVNELAAVPESSRLDVWVQGTSDFPWVEDHHVRVFVNGVFVAESRWDGKTAHTIAAEVGPGVLREGENVLELESLADTGAAYSMVMLDRFRVRYPRDVRALENAAYVLDVTGAVPRWMASQSSFDAERSYVGVDALSRPEQRRVSSPRLEKRRRAEYLVIAPSSLLETARPLLRHRRRQGLRVAHASTEAIASEFGHGELTPDAIRSFIAYAYHEWRAPKLRYVLLLGDATYDFKDYLGTGVANQLPPYMVRTSYLWTASDPAYAAVNGDDLLPDVAIGRLPARSNEELAVMVSKILDYERAPQAPDASFVLVADNSDAAGDFDNDAEEIASSVFASRDTKRIYLSELGTSGTRDAIVEAFDAGASTVSYLGHGGIHLWAGENLFNASKVELLSPQAQQPILLTMNCLNGYFHFPYFDALSEALLKPGDKGVIAAFSPSGLSLNAPAHRYHKALLHQLLSGDHARLGDAVLAAQHRYADSGAFPELLAIYHLFGDPALRVK